MRRVWKRKRKNIFYTLMADVLFNLLAFYMLTIGGLKNQVGLLAAANQGLNAKNSMLTNENQGYKTKIGDLNYENGGLKKTISNQGQQLGSMQEEIDKLARFRPGKPVTLMIVIDTTISMGVPIQELRTGMESICEIMPHRSEDFRVGILAFRQGVVERYPITQVLPSHEDERKSQESVLAFIDTLQPGRSWTEHKSVLLEAVRAIKRDQGRQDKNGEVILAVIGDVGPSELEEPRNAFSRAERETKKQIVNGLKKWTAMGNHSVYSLYADSTYTEQDPSRAESREWFEELGSVSPKSRFFSDTAALLQAVHHATGK